uniref:Uncharacterized protein n=1 Tax=Populus alba TaxID=43335 RepID=A0A4U5MQ83_POPAL|nr:hypothetical protein D5086_0000302040 [Populus alba]
MGLRGCNCLQLGKFQLIKLLTTTLHSSPPPPDFFLLPSPPAIPLPSFPPTPDKLASVSSNNAHSTDLPSVEASLFLLKTTVVPPVWTRGFLLLRPSPPRLQRPRTDPAQSPPEPAVLAEDPAASPIVGIFPSQLLPSPAASSPRPKEGRSAPRAAAPSSSNIQPSPSPDRLLLHDDQPPEKKKKQE